MVEQFEIPLPPLAKQKRIAGILNERMAATDKARSAAEARITATKILPPAYLRQVFPRLGQGLPAGWRWAKLRDICSLRIENRNPKEKKEERFTYIDISSVDNERKKIEGARELKFSEAPSRARQVINQNDVIVSTTRPGLNAVAIVPADLDGQICSTGFCVLRPNPDVVIPELLFFFAQTPQFVSGLKELVKGALYPAVTDDQVRAVAMPVPPRSAQSQIAAVLNEQLNFAGQLRMKIDAQLAEINALPQSLLRQAFNGEL